MFSDVDLGHFYSTDLEIVVFTPGPGPDSGSRTQSP